MVPGGQAHRTHGSPLTAAGEAKAKAVGAAMQALGLRDPLVLASPRKRAVRTAEVAGLPVRRVWDDLAEWDYGDYEGLTTPQIRERAPHWTVWTRRAPRRVGGVGAIARGHGDRRRERAAGRA